MSIWSKLFGVKEPPKPTVLTAGDTKIHDVVKRGDCGKVKAPLKECPDLVFSKDTHDQPLLYTAAAKDYKDVAELLRLHGGYE